MFRVTSKAKYFIVNFARQTTKLENRTFSLSWTIICFSLNKLILFYSYWLIYLTPQKTMSPSKTAACLNEQLRSTETRVPSLSWSFNTERYVVENYTNRENRLLIPAIWSRSCYLNSVHFSFLICKMGIILSGTWH